MQTLNVDFANGAHAAAADPDIIMVGEIRDRDTADMAVQAALTGHSSLSRCTPTMRRARSRGCRPVPPYLISGRCRRDGAAARPHALPALQEAGDAPDEEAWRMLTAPFRADLPAQVQMAVGCLECRMTGYYGRMGLYEIMTLTPTLRRLIHAESEDAKNREQAYREGMKPLRVSGASKIAAGLSTVEEVMKVAPLA